MIFVTAAIIKNENGEILICQRGAGGSCAFLWEFPGGKLEPDETAEQCIVRECREELSIDIEITDIFAETSYRYPEREISFIFYNAVITGGKPEKSVHKSIIWVHAEELADYEFCPADVEIVKQLADIAGR